MRIGALAPLTKPGWVEAGQHLLAGLELGVRRINDDGGLLGEPLELLVRDTAADPQRAVAAVDELAALGIVALAGEYHSVVARTVATRADALGLPFLCSSAVLDVLTEAPTNYVARIAPAQSRGWRIYADSLLGAGHRRVAAATQPSVYWAAGAKILRDRLSAHGADLSTFDVESLSPGGLCDALAGSGATALLLLVGFPTPAVPIVKAVRSDPRLADVTIGAPAGQPEFGEWRALLGRDGAAIPFLRYLPSQLTPLGEHVESVLRKQLSGPVSFVAFEGFDTIIALADALSRRDPSKGDAEIWSSVDVEGTRGRIRFSQVPGINVWQWSWPPIQVVERSLEQEEHFRVL